MKTIKSFALPIKLLIAMGAIYYVLRQNWLDLNALKGWLLRPDFFAVAMLMLTLVLCCKVLRWSLICQAQGLNVSLWRLFQCSLIGGFFGSFVPGSSLSGDAIKAWYLSREKPQSKVSSFLGVVFDRGIGMYTLVMYSSITLKLYSAPPALAPLELMLDTISILGSLGLIAVSLVPQLRAFYAPKVILSSVALSALSVLFTIGCFLYMGARLDLAVLPEHYFSFVPLGILIGVLPIVPNGIGVGQLAFSTLFSLAGYTDVRAVVTLLTIFQIYWFLFNLSGFVFFLSQTSRPVREAS